MRGKAYKQQKKLQQKKAKIKADRIKFENTILNLDDKKAYRLQKADGSFYLHGQTHLGKFWKDYFNYLKNGNNKS